MLATVLTWVVPPNAFQRSGIEVPGVGPREVVVPETFAPVEGAGRSFGGRVLRSLGMVLKAPVLGIADPGAIVWDEIVAFWIILWLLMPASIWAQFAAFVLFRFFDAVKPGPVGWADRRFKQQPGEPIGPRQGFGILFDDLVAAGCTLLVIALGVRLWD